MRGPKTNFKTIAREWGILSLYFRSGRTFSYSLLVQKYCNRDQSDWYKE